MSKQFPSRVPVIRLLLISAIVMGCSGVIQPEITEEPEVREDIITITIAPKIPLDLPAGSTLQDAGVFAWQTFIAMTWPAQAQGPTSFPREQPYLEGRYGGAGPTGQVVWETFRHKSEIFPGEKEGSPVTVTPNGYVDDEGTDYGYDSIPQYKYQDEISPALGQTVPKIPPFNNLDEIDQISLDDMHAGIAKPYTTTSSNEVHPVDRILYQAKANRMLYTYIAKNRLFEQTITNPGIWRRNAAFNLTVDDPNQFQEPYIDLPASIPAENQVGSIEIKSAWRRLNTDKTSPYYDDPARFYTAPVRYYRLEDGKPKFVDSNNNFVDSNNPDHPEIWGLVALHIIHKTQSNPSFVYTSFEQVDNIRAPDGGVVEEPDGTIKQQYKGVEPFTPPLTITASRPATNGSDATGQIVKAGPGTFNTNGPQLYYKNKSPFLHGVTAPIGINRRLHAIPPSIVAVNRAAQETIRTYNPDAVWQFYKLVNVQAQTLPSFVDRSQVDSLSEEDRASYYMANIVVETNVPLQQFSGGLSAGDMVPGFMNSGNTDYFLMNRPAFLDPDTFLGLERKKGVAATNTYVKQEPVAGGSVWKKLNMGGCLGCHGGQGQTVGGDFSVIVARGRVPNPETAFGGTEQQS